MQKIKAIIVDDEKWARTVLNSLLLRDFDSIEIVAQCNDVLSAVKQIKKSQPDVVFLDIEMPNYAGYEIVNFFKEIPFKIIFVTAFDKYAIKAFELNAVDYLVKPIDREKLKKAINKLDVNLKKENKITHYNELLKSIQNGKHQKIILPELGDRRVVELKNIIAIKAEGAYTTIYINDKYITVSKTLKYFENLLSDSSCFFRIHRSWIVNLNYVEKINKTENILLMYNNLTAQISRSKFEEFELAIKQY